MSNSILNDILPINDRNISVADRRETAIRHILDHCKNEKNRMAMINVISKQETERSLQKAVYDLLLKYEGMGVV